MQESLEVDAAGAELECLLLRHQLRHDDVHGRGILTTSTGPCIHHVARGGGGSIPDSAATGGAAHSSLDVLLLLGGLGGGTHRVIVVVLDICTGLGGERRGSPEYLLLWWLLLLRGIALLLLEGLLLEGFERHEHVADVELNLLRRSFPPPRAHHAPRPSRWDPGEARRPERTPDLQRRWGQGLGEGRGSGGGCEGGCRERRRRHEVQDRVWGRAGISRRTEGAGIAGEGAASRRRRRRGHRGGGGEGTRGNRGSGAWGGGGSATAEPCTIVECARLRYKHNSSRSVSFRSQYNRFHVILVPTTVYKRTHR
jgi:hypothetical protein